MPFHEREVRALISLLLRFRREKELGERSQSAIARRAGISQARVSNWEQAANPDYTLGRESLKRLLTFGLHFPYEEVDAILWLACSLWRDDKDVLTPGEVKDFLESVYDHSAVFQRRSPQEYEQILTKILKRIEEKSRPASPLTIFSAAPSGRLDFERALLEMEYTEQPKMSVTNLPPFFSRPWEIEERWHRQVFGADTKEYHDMVQVVKQRYDWWESWIERYPYRVIGERTGIERYFAEGRQGKAMLKPSDVRAQGERWIKLLQRHDNYAFAVSDALVLMKYILFGISHLMLVVSEPRQDDPARSGIEAIRIADPLLTLRFRLEFEQTWQNIPEENKDKERIIEWLRVQIS
ncbi:MAG: helix-turn-helix transcriptional regulator [Chloroflexi bacterium]|nr:helix-turn-helix transcriptional regulator [Chloroflexota bacterium]